jgi:hypothetical protein
MIGTLTAGQFAIFDTVMGSLGASKFHFHGVCTHEARVSRLRARVVARPCTLRLARSPSAPAPATPLRPCSLKPPAHLCALAHAADTIPLAPNPSSARGPGGADPAKAPH